jgi:valyl-tRNA synthetase
MQGGEVQGEINPQLLFRDDKWILLRLDGAIREITASLAGYKFNEAAQILHRFFWSELCDWYLEAAKAVFFGDDAAAKANTLAVLDFVLSHALRLFHPFLPFITEELWHGLGYNREMPENQGGKSIMFAPWPKPLDEEFQKHYVLDETDAQVAAAAYELVSLGRNLRREGNIPSNKKVKFVFRNAHPVSAHDAEVMRILLNAETLEVSPNYEPKKGTPAARSPLGTLYLPLEGSIDVDAEKTRLAKEIEKIQLEIEKVRQKLSNPAFTEKVPPAVLEEHKKRLADWESKQSRVHEALNALQG